MNSDDEDIDLDLEAAQDLFGNNDNVPQGLYCFREYIPPFILDETLSAITIPAHLEQVFHFGRLDRFESLATRCLQALTLAGIERSEFNQYQINKYSPGQEMKSHVDLMKFKDGIVIVSLKGTCRMIFTHELLCLEHQLDLFPGDVVVLTGSSRYDWMHAVTDVAKDRISITFRNMELNDQGLVDQT